MQHKSKKMKLGHNEVLSIYFSWSLTPIAK